MLTRKQTAHQLFGNPCDLPPTQLPTVGDVLRLIGKYKLEDVEVTNPKFANKNEAIKKAVNDVASLWEKAIGDRSKAPILPDKTINNRIRRIYEKGLEITRSHPKEEIVAKFKDDMGNLFDICSCSCPSGTCEAAKCKLNKCDGYHLLCNCQIKVPKMEVRFLLDQRSERNMQIVGVDSVVTDMWRRAEERELAEDLRSIKHKQNLVKQREEAFEASKEFENLDENLNIVESSNHDKDYNPPVWLEDIGQNRTRLPKTAEACDRYLIGDRAGAAIASAVLVDYGIVNNNDKTQVIGPRKLAAERHRYRVEAIKKEKDNLGEINSLYFDGKKTPTRVLVRNPKTGRWSPKLVVEDHYVIIVEPGSQYLSHVTPISGHGKVIAGAIYKFLVEEKLQDNPILVVGADGTNSNVGAENGAIHFLEMMLGKAVHYFICQLHGNELPFRAVFYYYDGKPNGPEHWSGPIGKSIKGTLSGTPVVTFQPVPFPDFPGLPDEVVDDLSWDQKYLYRISMGVITGVVTDDLAAIEPGPPCVSRWNTLWSRILRLYIATLRPSHQLKRIVNMIIKFSAPMWFIIKCNPLATQGSLNTFKAMQLLKNLNPAEKSVAKKALQRNAFFAHSDQLLLAMCADPDEFIRRKAVKLIRNLRDQVQVQEEVQGEEDDNTENDSECEVDNDLIQYTDDDTDEEENEEYLGFELDESIREVRVPALKWQAKSYHTMIDWKDSFESEPPYIAQLSDHDVVNILDRPLQVPRWVNNTQAVERGIKAVTEACTAVTGHLERDGYIKQRMHSRKLMPKFNTKRDFNHNI